jgi:hypothetical protein
VGEIDAERKGLEATTITINNECGVGALAFDQLGLPGFQFIQDPLDYESRTHHSKMGAKPQHYLTSNCSWRLHEHALAS